MESYRITIPLKVHGNTPLLRSKKPISLFLTETYISGKNSINTLSSQVANYTLNSTEKEIYAHFL